MGLKSAAVIVIISVATVFAQQSSSVGATGGPVMAPQGMQRSTSRWGNPNAANRQPGSISSRSFQQRVQDLQGTVDKMHIVLKQMQSKAGASAKDPLVNANLQMWTLMVEQLDKQLQELKQAEASRADLEARRAALYKQADAKAETAAKEARSGSAASAHAAQTSASDSQPAASAPTNQAAPKTSPN